METSIIRPGPPTLVSPSVSDDKSTGTWDFPGGPVVKNLHSHCRGRGFNPWSGN